MTHLLCKLFIPKGASPTDPKIRTRYGTLSTIVGILINLLLFAGKFIIGLLLGFTSILADAFNNLSDAGSSLVSLVSFRIAGKPADREHPLGHARMEYIASMVISFLILLIGYELFVDSIDAILHPNVLETNVVSIVILSLAILMKLWLFFFYRKIGKTIDSKVLFASATDSLGDVLSTSAVLASGIVIHFTEWYVLDGIVGILVACLILKAGFSIFMDSMHSLLGEAPSDELVEQIQSVVMSYPEALGIHDMMVHNYGPGHAVASLHVEVDGAAEIFHSHDVIDNIEKHLHTELGVITTIHMDPIVVGDPKVDELKQEVLSIVKAIDDRMGIHDFRFVDGVTHQNLIFDITVPFEVSMTNSEIENAVTSKIQAKNPQHCTVITIDRQ